jgi:hypothetical protein
MPYLETAPATASLPLPAREPAALAGGAQAVIAAAVSLAALWWPDTLTAGVQATILAVAAAVLALVTGWRTAPARLALVYGLIQALVPAFVLLGLDLPPGADAAILALAAATLGIGHRGEVSPRAALPTESIRSLP